MAKMQTAAKKKTQISFIIRDELEARHRSFVNVTKSILKLNNFLILGTSI